MNSLAGKTILITGASGAVGTACLQVFRERGAQIVMTDRVAPPQPRLDDPNVCFELADVCDIRSVRSVFQSAIARFGRIDAAVLAAGVEGVVAAMEDISESDLDYVLAVNVKGCFFWMQECLRHMKPRRQGSIVALSSISGVVGTSSMAAYTMSKHAVMGLVRAAALETGQHNVRINAVCPGPIESDMMRRLDKAMMRQDPARFGGASNAALALPLQRYVSPTEVARMVAFLCGDESSSCHGGAYMIDGGFTAK